MTQRYLESVRNANKAKASICSYCTKPSIDIIAKEHEIKYVCKTHFILHGQQTISSFEE